MKPFGPNFYLRLSLIFVLVALFSNEWLLARLFSSDGTLSTSSLAIIRLFQTFNFFSAFFLFRHRKTGIKCAYREISLLGFNTLLALIFLSLFLHFFFIIKNKRQEVAKLSPENGFVDGRSLAIHKPELFNQLFSNYDRKEILDILTNRPGIKSHPTLEYMSTPTTSKHYNIGFEGVRYTKKINDSNVRSKIQNSIWIMGGSTTFGHGVFDDETIPSYLDDLDSSQDYLNFAVPSYNQNNEIEKLILLLKKGYRPKKVFFVDGLNDMVTMLRSNFHPTETPSRLFHAYNFAYNVRSRNSCVFHASYFSLASALPGFRDLQRAYMNHKNEKTVYSAQISNGTDNIYEPGGLYTTEPFKHFAQNHSESPFQERFKFSKDYLKKLKEYYLYNLSFLQNLSKGFGFEFQIFFQPIGLLSSENPFLVNKTQWEKSEMKQIMSFLVSGITSWIRNMKDPRFRDLSDADKNCKNCYRDATHYGPKLNKQIAEKMKLHFSSTH